MSPERWALVRRLVLANAVVLLFTLTLVPYVERLVVLAPASDWGSDWRWLEDGLKRLAAGLPLTRPEYVAGPWSQFQVGAQIPSYAWSLHPPYSAALYAPFMLVPDAVRPVVWAATMAAALAAATALAWPRRLWWGTGLLIATILLKPPINGAWLGFIDQVHYANPNALVALGIALVWIGRRRGSVALMSIGLVLAALKILPAATLGFWLLATRDRPDPARRSVAVAGAELAVLTLIVLLRDPGAINDMIRSTFNMVPWPGSSNFAPQVRLAHVLGADAAKVLLTPQLWANWLVIPAVAILATAPEWRIVRAVDRQLSAAYSGSDERQRRLPAPSSGQP